MWFDVSYGTVTSVLVKAKRRTVSELSATSQRTKVMDPHFMSLISGMAPGRVGQATPSLPPLMMPLATSDTAMPSSISMIPTTTRPLMPQALAPPPDMAVAVPVPVQPPVPFVNLYKCATGASSDGVCVCVYGGV